MNQESSELSLLKNILLKEELEQLNMAIEKIKNLEFSTFDEKSIQSRIVPLFDKMLLEKLSSKDGKTVEIFASYLSKIISKSTKIDPDNFRASMQSTISVAISQEIKQNKDQMIDAIYPILGGMIVKYVSTAIDTLKEDINKKLESKLSLASYSRKIKSTVTGVSEVEILLEESQETNIKSILIIQKDSGLLVAQSHSANKELQDTHMIASMTSAIKDFINDWISQNDALSEVQLLSYGESTLYIESAGSVYLVAFLDSEPEPSTKSEISEFFAPIIQKYSDFFFSFDGDDATTEITEIEAELNKFQNKNQEPKLSTKKRGAIKLIRDYYKEILIVLGVIFISYAAIEISEYIRQSNTEAEIKKYTNEVIEIDERDGTWILSGDITDPEHYTQILNIAKGNNHGDIVSNIKVSIEQIGKLKKKINILEKDIKELYKEIKERK